MIAQTVEEIARHCANVRDPRRRPRSYDAIEGSDGWTRIVSEVGRGDVIYRRRLGVGPIGTKRRCTLKSWRSWAATGTVLHCSGQTETCSSCGGALVRVQGPNVDAILCPVCDADASSFDEAPE